MDKEIIDKIMFDNFLKSVPTMVVDAKDRKTISAYGSIDVNDLMSAIDRLDKVPTYGELLKENKKQKEIIDRIDKYIKENIYSYYDSKGEKCIEETVFERSANPKELLDILKEVADE